MKGKNYIFILNYLLIICLIFSACASITKKDDYSSKYKIALSKYQYDYKDITISDLRGTYSTLYYLDEFGQLSDVLAGYQYIVTGIFKPSFHIDYNCKVSSNRYVVPYYSYENFKIKIKFYDYTGGKCIQIGEKEEEPPYGEGFFKYEFKDNNTLYPYFEISIECNVYENYLHCQNTDLIFKSDKIYMKPK